MVSKLHSIVVGVLVVVGSCSSRVVVGLVVGSSSSSVVVVG
jgi:hypothetical protein